MKKIISLFVLILLLSVFNFGQKTEITKGEYYQIYRTALKKGQEVSRRNISKQENYRDGKLYSTDEYLYEYLLPDREYYSHKESYSGKVNIVELIKIGEVFYCKRNNEGWKKSENWCADGSASGISNVISEKFTIEEVKNNNETLKLYQQVTTYKNSYSLNKDKEGLSYWQTKFWINKNGYIVRKESEDGLSEPNRINRKQSEIYEYNPKNLKIEAPIK